MMKLKTILFSLLLLPLQYLLAQNQQPFYNEIRNFGKQDSIRMPETESILFAGSSSFRMWKGLKDSFPAYQVINRGFGGSTLPDLIRYHEETILKYKPAQVIIYCGENDIASSDTVTPELVLERFSDLFSIIRKRYPGVQVSFVSIKPSPSRWHMKERMISANKLIRDFLEQQRNTSYIHVWDDMLNA